MSNFKLDVAFTNAQLETLYITNTNVVIAKPTGGNNPNVAWQVFKPLQANSLTWGEEYGIYASTSEVTNGAHLSQLSSVPPAAVMNKEYTLEDSGVITGPSSGGMNGAFTLKNAYSNKPYMTEGLFQNATVNGTEIIGNALSAVPVLLRSTAYMTPFTTVYIWLQSQVKSNTVVTDVFSPMTELKFGGDVDNIAVAYDSNSGKFIASSKAQLAPGIINHINASL